ncbi:MAG TPA: hypothetical protein VNL71_01900 [Chloroflexota bacterium]|nr:hypothetical protein [Chloroflexota bacterium]
MRKTHDYRYQYHGFWRPGGICRVRVFEEEDHPPVVLCSELPDNPNTSITNMAEYLAAEIIRAHFPQRFDATDEPIIWIEHYGLLSGESAASYARVHFDSYRPCQVAHGSGPVRLRIGHPQWEHISRTDVEALIGHSLDEQASVTTDERST